LPKCPKAGIAAPQVIRAVCAGSVHAGVSRHALPYSRGQHVRYPQALIGETPRVLTLCFSVIHSQSANIQPPRTSWTIHCIIGWNTRQLIPRWIPQISQHIATSWRLHIIIIIMGNHIGPVIKKIRNFNVKYYSAWAIEAREALEERGWMRWIDPATPTKEIKEENGSEIDIIEGLRAKALLSQSIGYEHKNRIHDCTTAAEIWSAFEDKFAYKSCEDEQRFKALLSQIRKTNAEDLDTFIASFDELAAQVGNAITDPIC
jgi:gag-polypeptide of LTR copia-type